MICLTCKGSGYLYTMIAGDKHIAQCPDCEGWGKHEPKTLPKKEPTTPINLDDLINDVTHGLE